MNQSTEDYIRGEYPESIEDARSIIDRHLVCLDEGFELDVDALALDIAGYFTGCLTVNGEPRVGRPKREGD